MTATAVKVDQISLSRLSPDPTDYATFIEIRFLDNLTQSLNCLYTLDSSEKVSEVLWSLEDEVVYHWNATSGVGTAEGIFDETVVSGNNLPDGNITIMFPNLLMEGNYTCIVRTVDYMEGSLQQHVPVIKFCEKQFFSILDVGSPGGDQNCTIRVDVYCKDPDPLVYPGPYKKKAGLYRGDGDDELFAPFKLNEEFLPNGFFTYNVSDHYHVGDETPKDVSIVVDVCNGYEDVFNGRQCAGFVATGFQSGYGCQDWRSYCNGSSPALPPLADVPSGQLDPKLECFVNDVTDTNGTCRAEVKPESTFGSLLFRCADEDCRMDWGDPAINNSMKMMACFEESTEWEDADPELKGKWPTCVCGETTSTTASSSTTTTTTTSTTTTQQPTTSTSAAEKLTWSSLLCLTLFLCSWWST